MPKANFINVEMLSEIRKEAARGVAEVLEDGTRSAIRKEVEGIRRTPLPDGAHYHGSLAILSTGQKEVTCHEPVKVISR